MLRMRAGVGLAGAPATWSPAAQRMPARMSLSTPPHLPSTRTGRMNEFQEIPVIPAVLLASAPIIPATRVPCQELPVTSQLRNGEPMAFLSESLIQSPGSEGSESRPPLSLAWSVPETKSNPGSSFPPASPRLRSGWSYSTPVSSTATTIPERPTSRSQASTALTAETSVLLRYHCPANKGSSGVACAYRRRSGTANSTAGSARSRSSTWSGVESATSIVVASSELETSRFRVMARPVRLARAWIRSAPVASFITEAPAESPRSLKITPAV